MEEENKDFAQLIEDICDQENAIGDIVFDDEFKENLLRLFEDEAIKKMLKLRNKIDLPHKKLFDGAQYFLTEEKITVKLDLHIFLKELITFLRKSLRSATNLVILTKFIVVAQP